MAQVYVTRQIPEIGIKLLRAAGHTVDISKKNGVLRPKELKKELSKKPYDAVICLLTDTINKDVFDTVPTAKIFANYAVGYNNIAVDEATAAGVSITNTPGVLTDTVAEFTSSLILSVAKRIPEADFFTRNGKYKGWAPELMLGSDLKGKTLGILGAGRIGYGVAERMHKGFGMEIIYNDIKKSEIIEKNLKAKFKKTTEDVLKEADVVSVHVPLLPSTIHLINAKRLSMMKSTAYLINTSRGPVIDEDALVKALKDGTIKGAGLDVFEEEPKLAKGLNRLPNIVITPHIASASEETRNKMSEMAAQNVLDFLNDETPEFVVNK